MADSRGFPRAVTGVKKRRRGRSEYFQRQEVTGTEQKSPPEGFAHLEDTRKQDWNEEEVQKWFESYENGKFKEYAKDFQKFNGKDLFELEEKICKETYGNLNGSLLYKQIQKLKEGKSYS